MRIYLFSKHADFSFKNQFLSKVRSVVHLTDPLPSPQEPFYRKVVNEAKEIDKIIEGVGRM